MVAAKTPTQKPVSIFNVNVLKLPETNLQVVMKRVLEGDFENEKHILRTYVFMNDVLISASVRKGTLSTLAKLRKTLLAEGRKTRKAAPMVRVRCFIDTAPNAVRGYTRRKVKKVSK